MGNIKVSVEYTNKNGSKGRISSRVYHSEVTFYASTNLNGGTFSTFDQADEFMKKSGYYKLDEAVNSRRLAPLAN